MPIINASWKFQLKEKYRFSFSLENSFLHKNVEVTPAFARRHSRSFKPAKHLEFCMQLAAAILENWRKIKVG